MKTVSRTEQAKRFKFSSMAENYKFRPPYPPQVFEILMNLLAKSNTPRVLDIGCGTGKICLNLVRTDVKVDAVDFSLEMISKGKKAPNGDHPNLNWICSSVEDAILESGYGLVTAGASIHWFDLDTILPRLRSLMAENGYLAVIDGDSHSKAAWGEKEWEIMADFHLKTSGASVLWIRQGYIPKEGKTQILNHPRFECIDYRVTKPYPISQTIDEYLACLHSRQTFCVDVIEKKTIKKFDESIRDLLRRYSRGNKLNFSVVSRIEWGKIK